MSERLEFWLPRFDFRETHSIQVRSTAERTYEALRTLDMAASAWVKLLFRLRGLPAYALRFEGLEKMGFVRLEERPHREMILGLVGRFWTPRGGILRLDRDRFSRFQEAGYAKVVWNFLISGGEGGPLVVTTETRVFCTDPESRRSFRVYWLLVRPFSGSIRKRMLGAVKRKAEAC